MSEHEERPAPTTPRPEGAPPGQAPKPRPVEALIFERSQELFLRWYRGELTDADLMAGVDMIRAEVGLGPMLEPQKAQLIEVLRGSR